jgi:CMP/dCMP kinase
MSTPGPMPTTASLVVAVDGPSGSGKSTVSRAVARRLGLRYLDTGSLYRAVTLAVLEARVDPAASGPVVAVGTAARLEPSTDPERPGIRLDGRDVSREIRTPAVTAAVSAVSAVPGVRARLLDLQRDLIGSGGIVVEGRDIATTVAPDAAVKVFLTAAPAARADRRRREEGSVGGTAATRAALERRDALDSTRAVSPLAQAPDAVVVDSTGLDVDAVVDRVLELCTAALDVPEAAR